MNTEGTVVIGGIEYIPANQKSEENVVFTGEETIASRMIGKKVLVRSRSEGVNCGEVVIADETGVELKNCRRLWYHKPKDSSTSWYEGVAVSGLDPESKVSCTVPTKVIIEDYSMTECSPEAYNSIMGQKPNES